jgi:hypothetical protein
LAERGTLEFYREQVTRLMSLAETMSDPGSRLELLQVAAGFQKLGDHHAALAANMMRVPAKQSA